ncbi:hypothetical protein CBOM_04558 [Ceraceosorus bombacis]|uniref:Uncharacterized protein n=1 Tax=Ceraceosorus bombacis TaxID=401625 RepID=A0A0P1BP29_9BASI|nr:hypothetical protein CBOM_04558 [Ceraceosorus bombacis]
MKGTNFVTLLAFVLAAVASQSSALPASITSEATQGAILNARLALPLEGKALSSIAEHKVLPDIAANTVKKPGLVKKTWGSMRKHPYRTAAVLTGLGTGAATIAGVAQYQHMHDQELKKLKRPYQDDIDAYMKEVAQNPARRSIENLAASESQAVEIAARGLPQPASTAFTDGVQSVFRRYGVKTAGRLSAPPEALFERRKAEDLLPRQVELTSVGKKAEKIIHLGSPGGVKPTKLRRVRSFTKTYVRKHPVTTSVLPRDEASASLLTRDDQAEEQNVESEHGSHLHERSVSSAELERRAGAGLLKSLGKIFTKKKAGPATKVLATGLVAGGTIGGTYMLAHGLTHHVAKNDAKMDFITKPQAYKWGDQKITEDPQAYVFPTGPTNPQTIEIPITLTPVGEADKGAK